MKKRFILVFLSSFLFFPNALLGQTSQTENNLTEASENLQEEATDKGLQTRIFTIVENIQQDYEKGLEEGKVTDNFLAMRNYVPTPGDIFTLLITAAGIRSDGTLSTPQQYTIQLQENYNLNIPFIETVNTKGKKLSEIQNQVIKKIKGLMPVQYVEFRLTTPAQFNVFVYGKVKQPGYILANSVTTVIKAIAIAKGFEEEGSYRNIQIRRDNEELTIDISKFFIEADFDSNPTVRPGDIIYIPEAEKIVNISGAVKYPGKYELLPDENLNTLIDLAGGFTPGALRENIEIERIKGDGGYNTLITSYKEAESLSPKKGDNIKVHSIYKISKNITIEGAIYGSTIENENINRDSFIKVPKEPIRVDFPYRPGITLMSLLDKAGGPTPLAVADKSHIIKETTGEKINIDIERLWKTRNTKLDIELSPGDYVYIPIEELKVFVTGDVVNPGYYSYIPGKKVLYYLLLAGGINEASGDPGIIYIVDELGIKTKVTTDNNVSPSDHIHVGRKLQIFITGEVAKPGAYNHSEDFTVSDYLLQAGGVNENTGNSNRIYLVDELGNETRIHRTDKVEPGSHIHVPRKILFKADTFVQNALLATAWVSSIFGVVKLVFEIIDFVEQKTAPAQ